MTGAIQNLVRNTDAAVARLYLSLFRERNALVSFLFHSLFRNQSEISSNMVDPLQRTTVSEFRQFIEYYLEHGYRFISLTDLEAGILPDQKYALITFDDGYYNNLLALPILQEFKVPATFFIATDAVRENKCYWWDVLHRERAAQQVSHHDIQAEALSFKTMRTEQIEAELTQRFGPNAFKPRGDIDRPFSPAELKEFAASPYVLLGNHTAAHAILTNYTPEGIHRQIQGAQDALYEMTGVRASAIAYPNGAFNDQVMEICREIGLTFGFTVRPEKHQLPLDRNTPDLLRLGRFTPHGETPIVSQCRTYRSDLLFYGKFRDGYLRFVRGEQVTQ